VAHLLNASFALPSKGTKGFLLFGEQNDHFFNELSQAALLVEQ